MIFYILSVIAGLAVLIAFILGVMTERTTSRFFYPHGSMSRKSWLEAFKLGGLYAIVAAVISAFVLVVYFAFVAVPMSRAVRDGSPNFTYYEVSKTDHYLQALNLGEGTPEGWFFLASGTLDNERYLTYIQQEDDGAYIVKRLPADEARIYETDTAAYVEVVTTRTDDPSFWLPVQGLAGPTITKFYIPAGSIVQDYSIEP